MPSSHRRLLTCLAALTLVLTPGFAWAYVDPNAGGMLFQLLAPVFAAIVGAWLVVRRWISATFRRMWRRLTGRSADAE
jgi:hypothetical protein